MWAGVLFWSVWRRVLSVIQNRHIPSHPHGPSSAPSRTVCRVYPIKCFFLILRAWAATSTRGQGILGRGGGAEGTLAQQSADGRGGGVRQHRLCTHP
eukprot:3177613-Prymnesium_polylepis.1